MEINRVVIGEAIALPQVGIFQPEIVGTEPVDKKIIKIRGHPECVKVSVKNYNVGLVLVEIRQQLLLNHRNSGELRKDPVIPGG